MSIIVTILIIIIYWGRNRWRWWRRCCNTISTHTFLITSTIAIISTNWRWRWAIIRCFTTSIYAFFIYTTILITSAYWLWWRWRWNCYTFSFITFLISSTICIISTLVGYHTLIIYTFLWIRTSCYSTSLIFTLFSNLITNLWPWTTISRI